LGPKSGKATTTAKTKTTALKATALKATPKAKAKAAA